MANELLDFVMSLVRDPAVAARYAADPDGVLTDAGLSGVTSADVNNLLPAVSDSLAMAAPPVGGAVGTEGNVWTGGAATAAFDAFTPHHAGVVDAQYAVQHPVISLSGSAPPSIQDPWFTRDHQVNPVDPVVPPVVEAVREAEVWWAGPEQAVDDPHAAFEHHRVDHPDLSGFDPID